MPDASQPATMSALRVLADGAAAVARGSDLDASLEQLLRVGMEASGARRGAILVQDPDQAELEVAIAIGYPDPSRTGVTSAVGGNDVMADAASRPAGQIDAAGGDDAGLVSLLPLIVGQDSIDRTVGMLVIERAGAPLDEDGRSLLYAVADLAAAAVDRAQLHSVAMERADWFERIASSDPLTGLANRHVLGRVLEHELTRAGRQDSEVSLVVFDVDAFREANESAGREVGDRLLQEVAAAIAGSIRMIDTVARLGGDEFVVVAPGAGGLIVARRVMDAINQLSAVLDRSVSVSAGVARFPVHGATPDELLNAAMLAMEGGRASGRSGLVEASAARPVEG